MVEDVICCRKLLQVMRSWSDEWTVGQVDSIIRSKDTSMLQTLKITDRAVRSQVRLFNTEEYYFMVDMVELEKLISDDKIKPIKW